MFQIALAAKKVQDNVNTVEEAEWSLEPAAGDGASSPSYTAAGLSPAVTLSTIIFIRCYSYVFFHKSYHKIAKWQSELEKNILHLFLKNGH